jgi:aminopeptidase N
MRRQFLLWGFFLIIGSYATGQRLPAAVVPDHYELTFTPDFTKDNFSGDEAIQVRLLSPASQIVLHAAEIDFKEVSIASNGITQKATVALDKKSEIATLRVANPIAAGPATIHVRYTGILNNELR